MAAIANTNGVPTLKQPRRKWLWAILAIPLSFAFAVWWFTEPLVEKGVEVAGVAQVAKPAQSRSLLGGKLTWPESKLEGEESKRFLLGFIEEVARQIDGFEGYTATFKKQERINGKLLPEQTLAMKVRQRPFAIYFKFLAPTAGKEVVYAEGHHDNMVIAHNGDWTRRLVPRLRIDPTSKLALADSRHPITEAGLANMARKLFAFRKLDLEDTDAVTILDRITDAQGRVWLRSVHLHSQKNPSRPYTRVEVLYDSLSFLPIQISSWDWLEAGQSGEPPLAERYRYENIVIDPSLTALDFDPANPNYEFMRF